MKKPVFCLIILGLANLLFSQPTNTNPTVLLNDIVKRTPAEEERVLPFPELRESDIFWEKRVWRIIDTREKINLPFRYPAKPFFSILEDAIRNGELTAYSVEDEDFTRALDQKDIFDQLYRRDTVPVMDPVTGDVSYQEVTNALDTDDIKRYRIKELWFFDSRTSTLKVRVLGIAPMKEEFDENGNFRFERPLFWINYPQARALLAQHKVFNAGNDHSPMTWEDLFEMRYFASYVIKASNVHDDRLDAYLSGVELLLESAKIEQEIFNYEHDLWSY